MYYVYLLKITGRVLEVQVKIQVLYQLGGIEQRICFRE